jgi:excisionase family DNA binding protein
MRNIGVIVGTFPAGTGEVTVKVREKTISEAERQRRNQQRAMSIDQFCARYGVGRTTAYEEIKEARLRGLKCGKRTIITEDDAEDWLRRLPAIKPSAASERFGKNSAALGQPGASACLGDAGAPCIGSRRERLA